MPKTNKLAKYPKWNYAFEQTVPRSFVHRTSVSEVFLTDAVKCGELHFQCAAQLPRAHAYYNDHTHQTPHYDMLLLLEIFRQASIYISHSYLDVNPTDKFIYLDSETRVLQHGKLIIENCSAPAVVDVKIIDEYYRKGIRTGVTLDMTLVMNDEPVAHKRMGIRWMDIGSWNRMRTKSISLASKKSSNIIPPTSCLTPSIVGRQNCQNVVINKNLIVSKNGICANLNVDQNNPGLFDHPLDHIPGMLILEGFRQAGLIAAHRYQGINPEWLLLSGCKVRFTRIGELGVDTRCHITSETVCLANDQETVMMPVVMEQGGRTIATASLEFSPIHHDNQLRTAMSSPVVEEV